MMHKKSIDILAITETCLDNSWTNNKLVITGYNLFHRDRKTAQGGGITPITHFLLKGVSCVIDDLIHDWNQERMSNHHMYKGIDLSKVF